MSKKVFLYCLFSFLLLGGCEGQGLQPELGLNPRISQSGDDSSPSLAATGMAWIAP